MKKQYIIPAMQTVKVAQNLPIATSGSLSTSGATFYDDNATGAAMTKQNNYSVWDDDWSN